LTAVGVVRITCYGPSHLSFRETEERVVERYIQSRCVLVLVSRSGNEVWEENNQHTSKRQGIDGVREKTEGELKAWGEAIGKPNSRSSHPYKRSKGLVRRDFQGRE
jgi:hypothetical protein